MSVKLLSVIALAMTTQTLGQDGWFPWDGNEEPVPEDIPCDVAYCVAPCPGYAPPRYCPSNYSECSSGCACMLECRSPTYVCYPTKYCRPRRRFLPSKTTPTLQRNEVPAD